MLQYRSKGQLKFAMRHDAAAVGGMEKLPALKSGGDG
jgi:hypothetical protein